MCFSHGETRTITCSSGVQQLAPMGPAKFCLALRPGLKRFREEFEGKGVEAFAYMDDVSFDLMGDMANTVRAFAFLRRELEAIAIVVNTAKTMTLPPKGHAPTAEEISLFESVDVRIVDEGEVTVVGVLIGTDEYVLKRAMAVVRDGGANCLTRCLANMPDKQAVALIAIESLGQRASYLEKALDTGLSLEACKMGRQRGTVGVRKTHRAARSSGRTVIFSGGVPRESADFELSPASPSTPFHGRERVRAAVDRSESNVCLHWKQGGEPTGGSSTLHGSIITEVYTNSNQDQIWLVKIVEYIGFKVYRRS